MRGWSPFIGLQIEYSLIERTVERELVPMAKALNLGLTVWSPLRQAQGNIYGGRQVFHGWENFFLIGSAAGALIGLMFVVISLAAGNEPRQVSRGDASLRHANRFPLRGCFGYQRDFRNAWHFISCGRAFLGLR